MEVKWYYCPTNSERFRTLVKSWNLCYYIAQTITCSECWRSPGAANGTNSKTLQTRRLRITIKGISLGKKFDVNQCQHYDLRLLSVLISYKKRATVRHFADNVFFVGSFFLTFQWFCLTKVANNIRYKTTINVQRFHSPWMCTINKDVSFLSLKIFFIFDSVEVHKLHFVWNKLTKCWGKLYRLKKIWKRRNGNRGNLVWATIN